MQGIAAIGVEKFKMRYHTKLFVTNKPSINDRQLLRYTGNHRNSARDVQSQSRLIGTVQLWQLVVAMQLYVDWIVFASDIGRRDG
jgi:hypothetical protein